MQIKFLDYTSDTWVDEIERLYSRLNSPQPWLLPDHFTQVVLPKIGGEVVLFEQGGTDVGVGLLLPRRPVGTEFAAKDATQNFTLRFHPIGDAKVTPNHLLKSLQPYLKQVEAVFYDPLAQQTYQPTSILLNGVEIGRPSADEAVQIRQQQQLIWQATPDFLYPDDIHSTEFQLGSSLVSRVQGGSAGFLFGFYKHGGTRLPADWHQRFNGGWRLESQVMGVLPTYRGLGLSHKMKLVQAQLARDEGIGIVNWTADPLQFPNACLNFGRLRAFAFDFYPDYYPFRNELNQVPASRFGLTWLVDTPRVRTLEKVGDRTGQSQTQVLNLDDYPEIRPINRGYEEIGEPNNAQTIAIEIPTQWTMLQSDNLDEAQYWRQITDRLFTNYVGCDPGQYVVTGVGMSQDRCYLIGERATDALWGRLVCA